MTEYQAIKQIKEGINVKESKEWMYKKFIPLFKGNANLFCTYMKSNMFFEDFINEAYLAMESYIEWIDIDKINNPETFSIAYALRQKVKNALFRFASKYNKNIGNGTVYCEDGKEKFMPHDIDHSYNKDREDNLFDVVEDSIALNYSNPAYSEIIHEVIHNYIHHHDEVIKNPLVLIIEENGFTKKVTERPMKKWQLKYFELLFEKGVSITNINKRSDTPSKQAWYQTKKEFFPFIKERINRAIDLNMIAL